jgi:hypothetical protein
VERDAEDAQLDRKGGEARGPALDERRKQDEERENPPTGLTR